MYEQDPQRLPSAFATVGADSATRIWTAANAEFLAVQALATMARANVILPAGTLEEFVSLRVPSRQGSPVATEFCPWSNQELQVRMAGGAVANGGEIRLGDELDPAELLHRYPGLSANQQRLFQLRILIHELFHALDFRDVTQRTAGDHDAAIARQIQQIGFQMNLPGYARNEIDTDGRTGLVLERNGLLFPALRQNLDAYRVYWEAQGPVSEQAFATALRALGRTLFP
jgi:hypothetical protein